MKKAAISILLILFTTPTFSAEVSHTASIKTIYPLSDGSVGLRFDSDSSSCTNPNTPKYYNLRVGQSGVTEAALDRMLSLLLVAATSSMRVTVVFDDATSACYINRLQLNF